MSVTLWPRGRGPARLLCPWDSPDKNTGVGSRALLQWIFPTQGLSLCLLHLLYYRRILYHLSHRWGNFYFPVRASNEAGLISCFFSPSLLPPSPSPPRPFGLGASWPQPLCSSCPLCLHTHASVWPTPSASSSLSPDITSSSLFFIYIYIFFFFFFLLNSSLVAQMVKKNLSAIQETCVLSLGQEDPLEKGMAAHSAILPWEFHGQRSLAGYSLQGHKESDTPEWLTHTHSWFTMSHQSLLYSKAIRLYTYRHSFFPVIFHYCLSQDIEYSSLSYTVGSCSFIPYITADIC